MSDNIERQKEFFMLQTISCVGGFLLIAGLSQGGIWASCMVVLLVVFCSAGENRLVKRLKNTEVVHWTFSNWTLLASSLLFIYASNLMVKVLLLCCMLISLYVNLYRNCYYEKISYTYIRRIFIDLPVLAFYNLPAFWRWEEFSESRRKRRSWMVGLLSLIVILVCIYLPLYVAVDVYMGSVVIFFAEKIFTVLPMLLICVILGLIPAMVNYSVIRGLVEDIVLKNPERCMQTAENKSEDTADSQINETADNYIMEESVFKIILWGMVVVNFVLVGLQVSYLFQAQFSQQDLESLRNMQGALPLLTAIVISIVFIAISQYMTRKKGRDELKLVTLVYIITLVALLLLLMGRYVVKIFNNGIEEPDLLGLLAILILIVAICIYLYSISKKDFQIGGKVVLWGTALFVLLSVVPIEYIVAEVNVQVFMNKLDQEQIGEYVSENDIDLEYLSTLGYDAVPAMGRLLHISLPYGSTEKSVGQVVRDKLLKIFFQDLNEEERVQIAEKSAEEGVQQLIGILMGKVEYQVVGKRKIALQALAKSVGLKVN